MKHMALILAAILTTSCVSRQGSDRTEVVEAGLGSSIGPRPQTTCPVMEGKRINNRLYVDYQGFRIYVCCVPCVKAVRKNPEKYLKRLRAQGVAVEKVEQRADATENNAEEFEKQDKKQNDS